MLPVYGPHFGCAKCSVDSEAHTKAGECEL